MPDQKRERGPYSQCQACPREARKERQGSSRLTPSVLYPALSEEGPGPGVAGPPSCCGLASCLGRVLRSRPLYGDSGIFRGLCGIPEGGRAHANYIDRSRGAKGRAGWKEKASWTGGGPSVPAGAGKRLAAWAVCLLAPPRPGALPAAPTSLPRPDICVAAGGVVTDFDGDGMLDLVLSHGESMAQPLSVFRGNQVCKDVGTPEVRACPAWVACRPAGWGILVGRDLDLGLEGPARRPGYLGRQEERDLSQADDLFCWLVWPPHRVVLGHSRCQDRSCMQTLKPSLSIPVQPPLPTWMFIPLLPVSPAAPPEPPHPHLRASATTGFAWCLGPGSGPSPGVPRWYCTPRRAEPT